MPPFGRAVGVSPLSAVMFHRYALVVVGNAIAITHDSLDDFAHRAGQTLAADGDTFTHQFFLAAGVYTLNALGMTNANSGRIDWYIDGVTVVSLQDWYSAVDAHNVIKTAAVTVVGGGQHVLKGVVNGNTVPSGGYYVRLIAIALV
jgi:hypothetical protein